MKNKLTNDVIIKTATSAVFFILIGLTLFWLNKPDLDSVETSARRREYARAKVIAVLFDNAEPAFGYAEGRRLGQQSLEIEIRNGKRKGETYIMTNFMSVLGNVDVSAGDKIVVQIMYDTDDNVMPYMHNYDRWSVVGWSLIIFIAVMSVVGGRKGILSILGLVFTIVCLWFILMPMVLRGVNPILTAVIIVAITTTVCLILLDGFTRKAASAILGCVAGVSVAALFAAAVGYFTPLNGFNMDNAEELMLQTAYPNFSISGLFVCGIFISSLGAVMDVSMSVSSSISELKIVNPTMTAKELFTSGMNIGKDAMGTMANTLILAFFGASLSMMLATRVFDIQFVQLINTDWVAIEIIQSIAGTMGIVLTVPFVSFFGAQIISREWIKK